MLRIKHLKSGRGAGGIADYLENQKKSAEAKAGYYQNKAAPSQWLGQGATALGLEGAVDREQLIALLEGRLPDGTDLSTRGGRKDTARLGTDITLSAMKSYSLMAGGRGGAAGAAFAGCVLARGAGLAAVNAGSGKGFCSAV
ncbi:MAG: relaxase domain-containing protein [Gammaproteobacteria bacterium]|nr:relaxase domain-containing protein [Gammaproteobacteria bacterium]